MALIATLTMNPALDVVLVTERLVAGHKLRCPAPRQSAGGGGINAARTIQALGGEAVAIFPAGGATGARLVALLAAEKLRVTPVGIVGETRESIMVEERSSGRQYRFVVPGPHLSRVESGRCVEEVTALQPRPACLIVSGSLPPGVPGTILHELGDLCRKEGIALLADTSGAALQRLDGLDAWLIKPSLAELEAAVGHPLPDETAQIAAARSLLDRRVARTVLLSLGAAGALLIAQDTATRLRVPAIEGHRTVGAGDAMLGAVALAHTRGATLAEAARWGVAAGAATLLGPGTATLRRADVERLLKKVTAAPVVACAPMT